MRQRKIWAVLLFCSCVVVGCGGGGGGGGSATAGLGEQTLALPGLLSGALDIAGTARAVPSATMGALEAL